MIERERERKGPRERKVRGMEGTLIYKFPHVINSYLYKICTLKNKYVFTLLSASSLSIHVIDQPGVTIYKFDLRHTIALFASVNIRNSKFTYLQQKENMKMEQNKSFQNALNFT